MASEIKFLQNWNYDIYQEYNPIWKTYSPVLDNVSVLETRINFPKR